MMPSQFLCEDGLGPAVAAERSGLSPGAQLQQDCPSQGATEGSAFQWLVSGEYLPPQLSHILPPKSVLCPTGSEKTQDTSIGQMGQIRPERLSELPLSQCNMASTLLFHSEKGSSH